MKLQTLRQYQRESSIRYLETFVLGCRARYTTAAKLLEVDSAKVKSVKALYLNGPPDVVLLYPAYGVLCDRYNDAHFSPQENLFFNAQEEQDQRWTRYFWQRLLPALIENDDVVRNVLRAVYGIPDADPVAAGESFKQYAREMEMPEMGPSRHLEFA